MAGGTLILGALAILFVWWRLYPTKAAVRLWQSGRRPVAVVDAVFNPTHPSHSVGSVREEIIPTCEHKSVGWEKAVRLFHPELPSEGVSLPIELSGLARKLENGEELVLGLAKRPSEKGEDEFIVAWAYPKRA